MKEAKEFKTACELLKEVYDHGENFNLHDKIRNFLIKHNIPIQE